MVILRNIAFAVLFCFFAVGDGLSPSSQPKQDNNNNNQLQTNFDCDMCEFIMFTIDTYITLNSTEQEISRVVSEICNYVPSEYSQFCTSMIDSFGPVIIPLLVQRVPPTIICSDLGFCNTTNAALFKMLFLPLQVNESCAVCQWISKSLFGWLNPMKNQEQINAKFETLCRALGSNRDKKCKAIQKKSGNKIITDIQKRINPEKECIDLEYCENTPILPINPKASNQAKRS